jgi:hypothetical protein
MNGAIACGMFLWAGMLLGVSFIATPAKFLAPSLPLAQALDVGRSSFTSWRLSNGSCCPLF